MSTTCYEILSAFWPCIHSQHLTAYTFPNTQTHFTRTQAYSRMLHMESELKARSTAKAGGQATSKKQQQEQLHAYVSAWDGTEMDGFEDHEIAAKRPLEVHHW